MPKYTMSREEFEQKLGEWEKKKHYLDGVKEEERQLRDALVASGWISNEEGTNTMDLANGYQLKATVKFNYRVENDPAKLNGVMERLPAHISERLFKFKPELSITEYRRLDAALRRVVDRIITISPGAPSLEIKAPKGR